jgi:signal transduction histidine kinase
MPANPAGTIDRVVAGANRRRLRTRIVMSFLLLSILLTVLFASATFYIRDRLEREVVEKTMRREVESLVRQVETNPDRPPTFALYDAATYGEGKTDDINPLYRDLGPGVHEVREVGDDGKLHVWKAAVAKGRLATGKGFTTIVRLDVTDASDTTEKLRRWLIASVFAFTALALILSVWSASRIMRPLLELVKLIRDRGRSESDNDTPLAAHFADDEVGELAAALDAYSDRMKSTAKRERELNADVSHELRTPLAVIRSTVELMLDAPDLTPKMLERIQRIQRAQEGGTAITETLLNLSREERVSGNASVARIVEQLLEAHRLQMRRGKQLELRMEGNAALVVDAPDATVNVAVGNLIANAVKYTDAGSVTVRINEDSVDVLDTGPGLSEADERRMTERGYRGDAATNTKGGGIGLSIVTRICELYGWDVQIGNRRDGTQGTRASLLFNP